MRRIISVSALIAILAAGAACPAKAQGHAPDGAALTVGRLVIAAGIENREPIGLADTFSSDTPGVYCFLEANNIAADIEVAFVWILNGTEILETPMALKAAPRWRTWADKKLYGLEGDWKVELRDASGTVLRTVEFKVE